ncbi:hypothetical protein GCM10009851_29510 [Herbiconiux moechotypicola]|uniref:Spore protein YkvP/CgeB glycosyl transferase-like domain-containing protein n=1 Tax=Herbiconiux moechotypicola TaxID=637393 RepID=A0ABP5QU17_9MICO
MFAVSTDDLSEGRGDVYVALGLAKELSHRGWGVALWPMSRWGDDMPEQTTVVIAMVESFVPGLVPTGAARIAWVRNWTSTWMDLPYLQAFDAVWASSTRSAAALAERYHGEVAVVPIATDTALFRPGTGEPTRSVVLTANHWGSGRDLDEVVPLLAQEFDVTWYGQGAETPGTAGADSGSPLRLGAVPFFELPAIYSDALVVLDDLIPQAKAYGSQNSRLFESIASGAVVVTNTADGLDDLGLGEVPSYRDGAELVSIVRGLAENRAETAALQQRLAGVVTNRHSFAVRADEVEPLLETAVARAAGRDRTDDFLLAWAARERWEAIAQATSSRINHEALQTSLWEAHDLRGRLEAAGSELDDQRAAVSGLESRLVEAETAVQSERQQLEAYRSSRLHRAADRAQAVVRRARAAARRLRRR